MNAGTDLAMSIEIQNQQLAIQERQYVLLEKQAALLAKSKMVPDHLKNSIPDCMLIVELAYRLRQNIFLIANEIYQVHGKPALSAKFMVSLLNQSRLLTGRLKFRETGEKGKHTQGIVAYGVEALTGETIEGPEITIAMAHAEKWVERSGSKWKTMPELMLRNRAATFFIRQYFPEVVSGMQSDDELRDIGDAVPQPRTRKSKFTPGDLNNAEDADFTEATGTNVDPLTGEILSDDPPPAAATQQQPAADPLGPIPGLDDEPQASQQQADPQAPYHSPAFHACAKQLSECDTVNGIRAIKNSPIYKKMNQREQQEFDELAASKWRAGGIVDAAVS